MESKIGEIFEYNGEWYQCVESDSCGECSLFTTECGSGTKSDLADKVFGQCSKVRRTDNKHVIFKKLEKVGEPHFIEDEIFEGGKVYVQKFKVYKDFEGHKPICNDYILYDWKNRIISIEIKQNKEDMSNTETLWYGPDKKEAKSLKLSNLKPFSLELAKAGKPVCTRDGRKARIICFDRIDSTGCNLPIVALVQCEETEVLQLYHDDGKCDVKTDLDLMMLPEKKEGWVNVYKNQIHDTPESAEEGHKGIADYIKTIRVEWEE